LFMADLILLRPIWKSVFGKAWIACLVLFLALAGLRAYGLLGPADARMAVMLNFFLMWFLPLIFFTRTGRFTIGLKNPDRRIWLVWGPLLGILGAVLVFAVGYGLFGAGPDNWYVSIMNSWAVDSSMRELPRGMLFLIYTLPAVIFSPVGEEFFFRGMIHASVGEQWGQRAAALINATAFAAVHLLHHGIRWNGGGLDISWGSGFMWFLLMMGLSWIFTQCLRRGASIWPAVAAHAAFNLTMNIIIFVVLF
jgi:membrane protease YdiL (CAAX protease family)